MKEPKVSISALTFWLLTVIITGFLIGRFLFPNKNKEMQLSNDTLYKLNLRVRILEDSLDNSLWHLKDKTKKLEFIHDSLSNSDSIQKSIDSLNY